MDHVIVITKPSPYSGVPLYLTDKGFWNTRIDDTTRIFTLANEDCARFYACARHAGIAVIEAI